MTPGTEELPTEMGARLSALARGLTIVQRNAVLTCGDVQDRFPCGSCGARSPSGCPLPLTDRGAAANACNDAGAIVNGSGFRALRTHLQANPIPTSDSKDAGR